MNGSIKMSHSAIIAPTQYAVRAERDNIHLRMNAVSNEEGVVPVRHILGVGCAI